MKLVEVVFDRLHACGNIDNGAGGAYGISDGRHGVGLGVTSALPKRLEIRNCLMEPPTRPPYRSTALLAVQGPEPMVPP